ncbi:MAG: ABC transporter permease [Candidatus Pelagibacter sp.]|jgi:octopine/nopaline transport system permease protein|nr:ABC transporter permease subunit [Pelagibacterales bacterium SAG-MED39]
MELLAFGDTGWGDELFYATLMTIAVAITAMIIGFFFAIIFTPLKLSKNKFLNLIANSYTTVIRGVPELLVIYLFFFGGSAAIMFVASIFGYGEYIEINAFMTGAFSIGIISGAYSTEVFRGAIQSIDKGQFEAANVLGLSKFGKFFKIILPQTLRLALPNLSNVWQITLKDTSLISVTGLVEIMRQSYVAAGSTRDPLFFYSFAAVLYLLLTFLSMKLINRLEAKYSRGY